VRAYQKTRIAWERDCFYIYTNYWRCLATARRLASWVGLEYEWLDRGLQVGMLTSLKMFSRIRELKFSKASIEKWHLKQNKKYCFLSYSTFCHMPWTTWSMWLAGHPAKDCSNCLWSCIWIVSVAGAVFYDVTITVCRCWFVCRLLVGNFPQLDQLTGTHVHAFNSVTTRRHCRRPEGMGC